MYGDTNGAYFRERPDSEKSSNLFLVEFEPSGRHKTHVRHHTNEPETVPSAAPVPAPPVTPELEIVNASDFDGGSSKKKKKKGVSIGAIVGILVAVVLLALLAALFVLRSRRIAKTAGTQPRDGIIISGEKNKQQPFSEKTPPASVFRGGKAGMLFGGEEPMSGYEDNLKKTTTDTEVV